MNASVPILFLLALSLGFALFSIVAGSLSGPRRYNRVKLDSYECGIEPTPQPVGGGRFPVKYFLIAMLFILFDIEIVFLYPVGGRVRPARAARTGRDGAVHRHAGHRVRVRVASRRSRVGLTPVTPEETA